MFQKFLKGLTIFVLVFTITATALVQPASATTSEELEFTVQLIYMIPSSSTTYGVWESSESLETSGAIYETIEFAGWTDVGIFVKNVLGILRLSDAEGTITLKSQMHEDSIDLSTDLSTGLMKTSGTWVISDGTGVYARLHGQGSVNVSGKIYSSCPTNDYNVTGRCIMESRTYTGQMHFEP